MFVQLTDDELAARIAAEMVRVVKPSGHVLLIDWRYGKPGNPNYRAVSRRRIEGLFPQLAVVSQRSGALIPPVGRALSRFAPSLYFPVRAMLPWLVGLTATPLRKPPAVA